jgi:hypothetical protein
MTNIKVASSHTDKELKTMADIEKLKALSRATFVEMCRISAGAGSPHKALMAFAKFYEFLEDVELGERLNGQNIQFALEMGLREWSLPIGHRAEFPDDHGPYLDAIVRGSLRKVAACLAGTRTQESLAERTMYDGIIAIETKREQTAMGMAAWQAKQHKEDRNAEKALNKWREENDSL